MKRTLIFHPMVVALYPAAALYVQNINDVPLLETLPTFAILSLAAALLWWAATRLSRAIRKAALVVSVFFLLFFSYGHAIAALSNYLTLAGAQAQVLAFLQTQPASLLFLAVWCGLFGLIAVLTFKARSDFRLATQFMNAVSLALAVLALFKAGSILAANQKIEQDARAVQSQWVNLSETASLPPAGEKPDIYYIILDGYARADILQDIYQFDNSAFLAALQQKGFYVAGQAHSNYAITYQALASTFNFAYLNSLDEMVDRSTDNPTPILKLLNDNRLMHLLRQQGYQIAVYSSGLPFIESIPADIRYAPLIRLNPFENWMINRTPLRLWLMGTQYDVYRQRISYELEQLSQATTAAQPRLVFAHIMLPHPPFVFYGDGRPFTPEVEFSIGDGDASTGSIGREEYAARYREQVTYATRQAQKLLDHLLSLDPQPVILIQGDHGPGSQLDWASLENTNVHERLSIFSAYYFPDGDYSSLYPTITPVNSFRVVLNRYFNASYPLLEDRSYWAPWKRPYDWSDVTDILKAP